MCCDGFSCTRNALVAFNLIYIPISFILIGVGAYERGAAIFITITMFGGMIGCGVLLFFISILGLVGALRQHRVLVAVYMIILFILFLVQFALACACLAVNTDQKDKIVEKGWSMTGLSTQIKFQKTFDCCGFKDPNLNVTEILGHPACFGITECCNGHEDQYCCSGKEVNRTRSKQCPCDTCFGEVQERIYPAFLVTGGVGLLFSLTEVFGVLLAIGYLTLEKHVFPLTF